MEAPGDYISLKSSTPSFPHTDMQGAVIDEDDAPNFGPRTRRRARIAQTALELPFM